MIKHAFIPKQSNTTLFWRETSKPRVFLLRNVKVRAVSWKNGLKCAMSWPCISSCSCSLHPIGLCHLRSISSQDCCYQPIPPGDVPEKPKVGIAYAEGEARNGAETNEARVRARITSWSSLRGWKRTSPTSKWLRRGNFFGKKDGWGIRKIGKKVECDCDASLLSVYDFKLQEILKIISTEGALRRLMTYDDHPSIRHKASWSFDPSRPPMT